MQKFYLKAAKLICTRMKNNGCCYILNSINSPYKCQKNFEKIFKPNVYNKDPLYWWGSRFEKENQLARSLALLFMHEMEN